MASGTYISINTSKIGAVSAQASALGDKLDTTRSELTSLQKQLSETQNLLETYYGFCFNDAIPTGRLKDQQAMMTEIVSLLAQAEQLAKDADNKLNTKTDALKLAVAAMGGLAAAVYTTAVSVISKALTGETDCGDDWVDVSDWSRMPQTPAEASANISQRDEKIMEDWEKQDDEEEWNGYNKRNIAGAKSGEGSEVNCRWFTRKKVTAILGSSPSHKSIRKKAGKTIKAADGTEYLVTTYNSKKASSLVKSIQQPAQNIVLDFNGHAMMIDYIMDGKVYFSDNYYKRDWVNGYLKNGVYPNQCMTLDEFGKWYDKYNGNLVWAYSLTPQ